MRNTLLISALLLSSLVTACTPVPSAAGQYKEKITAEKKAADAEQGDPTPVDVGGDTGGDETGGEQEGDADAEGEVEAPAGGGGSGGDAAKGAALLGDCAGCHDAGIGKNVKLNKAAIARLDDAYKGKNAGLHGSMKDAFVTSRADLEAAMAAK